MKGNILLATYGFYGYCLFCVPPVPSIRYNFLGEVPRCVVPFSIDTKIEFSYTDYLI